MGQWRFNISVCYFDWLFKLDSEGASFQITTLRPGELTSGEDSHMVYKGALGTSVTTGILKTTVLNRNESTVILTCKSNWL